MRAADLLPQVRDRWTPPRGPTRIAAGLAVAVILSGLFKKLVLAKYLAVDLVDEAFFDPALYGAADLTLAAYAYSVQIYCDFSGYSDMAIGFAALLGFTLPKNFDQPFRAASMREFWRRWHISLSTWLRDYLYVPLWRLFTMRNLLVTMVLGGLWHGAAWTFLIWGALHGALLAAERATDARAAPRGSARRAVGVASTLHLVVLTFVIFRSESLPLLRDYLAGFARWDEPAELATPFVLALAAFGLAMHFTSPQATERAAAALGALPWPALGAVTGAGIALIGYLAPDELTPFIYFQF